jgi:hypothetical protein
MYMLSQQIALAFVLLSCALVPLTILVTMQRRRLLHLLKELEAAEQALAKQQALLRGPREWVPSIPNAPFPTAVFNARGSIMQASKTFLALAPVKTVEAFNAKTGADLVLLDKPIQRPITLRGENGLRHFTLVSWPLGGIGTAVALLEQTTSRRLRQEQHHFERELITLQRSLIKELAATESAKDALEELVMVTDLFESELTHNAVQSKHFDLAAVVKESFESCRPAFRNAKLGATLILPRSSLWVIGSTEETRRALSLLFGTIAEHAAPSSVVRVHMGTNAAKQPTVYVTLPGLHPHGESLKSIFSFGSATERRRVRATLTLARLLISEQHGSFTVENDEDHGVVAWLSLPPARKK